MAYVKIDIPIGKKLLHTLDEAAAILNVSRSYIEGLILNIDPVTQKHYLPALCAGKKRLIPHESLIELVARIEAGEQIQLPRMAYWPEWDFHSEWEEIRQQVIQRDGLICGICGGLVEKDDVHIDHIKPRSKGGSNELDNLQVAHSTCNMRKGNRELCPTLSTEAGE